MTREEAIKILKDMPRTPDQNRALMAIVGAEWVESEDERIRKNCIHFLELQKAHHADTSEIDDCIAYLEKQKEQKPVKLNDDTETGLDRALQIVKAAKGNLRGYQSDDGIYECDHAIQTLERILKNGIEQKPIPTEDEKTLLENEVKAFPCNYDKEFDDDAPTYDIAEHFYQLGRNSQKPAEWGEEDEHYFQNLIMAVDSTFSDGNTKNWLLNRLKSLRPQPHWKPSEEQMNRLGSITIALRKDFCYDVANFLESLYNDLKKL